VFSSIVIFWFALCVGVAIFIPGDLCSVSFGTARCLYSCIFILCMMFVLDSRGLMAALCLFWWICVFGASVLPGRFPVWISRSCWAARMAKSLLCLFLYVCCVCVQDKRAALEKFWNSIDSLGSEAVAKAVTVPQLLTLTACLSMDDAEAAWYYCRGLARVAYWGGASGCDVIMSAGCIPHVIDCLRRWPAHGPMGVVANACYALALLAEKGSATVGTAIKSIPGIRDTLQAAKASGLDDDWAADALSALGL